MYYDEEGRMYGYYCALCQEEVFKVPRGQESARERDELRAKVARVEALHVHAEREPGWDAGCLGCSMDWPCETVEALRGEDQ